MEMNSQKVWQSNLTSTRVMVGVCVITALGLLILAAVVSVMSVGTGIVTLFKNAWGFIFASSSAIIGIACYIAYSMKLEEDVSKMTYSEQTIHDVSLEKVRRMYIFLGAATIFFALAQMVRGPSGQNTFAIVSAASSIVFIGLSVFAHTMAKQIKTKYLTS